MNTQLQPMIQILVRVAFRGIGRQEKRLNLRFVPFQPGAHKLGRDVNPSTLYGLLMQTGIKRVELREPVFTELLNDGKSPPQVAKLGQVTVTNGGYEDE